MGKDSNVLIWLSLKSFFGKIPFPVLHIDTTYEFPEMLEFRDWATAHYKLNLIVKINEEARARGIGYETPRPGHGDARTEDGRVATGIGGTQMGRAHHRYPPRRRSDAGQGALLFAAERAVRMGLQGSAAGILGTIRHHRRSRRARPRAAVARLDRSGHLALHPTRENPHSADVFRAERQALSLVRLQPITKPIESNAATIEEIIAELDATRTSERAGRAQDHHERNAMQKLRAKGFM